LAQEFETEFWPACPIKIDKKNAKAEYLKARKTVSKKTILDGLPGYKLKEERRKAADGAKYKQHSPSRWLHDARWEDEISTGESGERQLVRGADGKTGG
jgi:hypothetical protein